MLKPVEIARALRQQMTTEERELWEYLRPTVLMAGNSGGNIRSFLK